MSIFKKQQISAINLYLCMSHESIAISSIQIENSK